MFKLTILCALVAACAASPIERIVNGTNARAGEIPYIVSLRGYRYHSCGGSIIDATHVLTAAHCVEGSGSNPPGMTIQYGLLAITNDATNEIAVSNVVSHPDYAPWDNYKNDVAVLTLASAIPLGGDVKAVRLPQQDQANPGNEDAVLAGWGLPFSGGDVMTDLQRVDLTLYADGDCERAHGGRTDRKYHVCAGIPEGGKGQCSGDSGGPLTVDGVQVGVVSWSVKPCAVRGYPGVFARVANYVDWIYWQVLES